MQLIQDFWDLLSQLNEILAFTFSVIAIWGFIKSPRWIAFWIRRWKEWKKFNETLKAFVGITSKGYGKFPEENRVALGNIKASFQFRQASETKKEFLRIHGLEMDGRIREARDEWRAVAQKIEKTSEPQDSELASLAWFNAGYLSAKLKEHEEALKDYDGSIRLYTESASAYYNRGNAKQALGLQEKALEDYDKAIDLNPEYALAYTNRGGAKGDMGYWPQALQDLDKAIDLNPKCADAYINRGAVKTYMGHWKEALQDYEEVIHLAPKYAAAYYYLGNIKRKREIGLLKDALRDCDKAICLGSEDVAAYNTRGVVKKDLGRLEEALQDFDQAIRVDPKDAVSYNNRGDVKRELGRPEEEVLEDLRKALQLAEFDSNSDLVNTIRQTMQETESGSTDSTP